MPKLYATTDPALSQRETENMERARKIAAQGMVLLENDGALPLPAGGRLALYGNGARQTVKGGTGSGDVNSRFVVNVEQGLESAGFTVTTKGWLDRFDAVLAAARQSYYADLRRAVQQDGASVIMRLFTDPFHEPPIVPVTQQDLEASDTDTAVYVLARNSGEGKDRRPTPGDYELFEEEKTAIAQLAAYYKKLIVVLNVGGVIDTKFLRATQGIDALLLMSQAGNIGGYALADVLTGAVTPSGHLAMTWAENYTDYPGAANFSHMNGNVDDEFYNEGVFVGYRYFDTFGIRPAYPFGYGLSYTTFSVEARQVLVNGNDAQAEVCVKNTGSFPGRQVVQLYVSAPAGKLEKPWQELRAYAKTAELQPGAQQTLTLRWSVDSMASYDESQAAWVLEAGRYEVRIGAHSRDTHIAEALVLDRAVVTQKLSHRLGEPVGLALLSARDAVPFAYDAEAQEKAAAPVLTLDADAIPCRTAVYANGAAEKIDQNPGKTLTLADVRQGRATLDELTAQLTNEEMADLCVGTARGGLGGSSIIGAASTLCPGAAGDTTSALQASRGVPNLVLADGPAGLRLSRSFMALPDGTPVPGFGEAPIPGMELANTEAPQPPADAVAYYQYCTAIPIATLLAQTWDVDAIEAAGDLVGGEMETFGVTLWLAPGMNLQRNPLCGRNFEYYSEDPLVAGRCAAADTRGVQKHPGAGTTIKHFAFNNQEDNRMHTNAHVSERAARELYLRGFEIAVREAQPMSIMTSYNLINGVHAANSYDLLTAIAREEWGFDGVVMTDWGTTGSIEMEPGKQFRYPSSTAAGCIAAGNDLIMPGSEQDVQGILAALIDPAAPCPLTRAQLQKAAANILKTALRSMDRP